MESIGSVIKYLRLEKCLTQKELAEGICSQAQFSKIEKGDSLPFSMTLYKLSERLGTDINHVLNLSIYKQFDYKMEVQLQIRMLVDQLQYDEVYELVKIEKRSPLYRSVTKYRQFIFRSYWHISLYKNKRFWSEVVKKYDRYIPSI